MSTKSALNESPAFSIAEDRTTILRWALRANILFSLLSALLLVFGSDEVAKFLNIQNVQIINRIPGPNFILDLGFVIFGFAAWLVYIATRHPIKKWMAISILVDEAAWVAASVLVLIFKALPITQPRLWSVLIVADIVFAFAIWEFIGIRQMGK